MGVDRSRDGRNYDIFDFPFTDENGAALILEMGIDITERKGAKEALQKAYDELEKRVAERTVELRRANEELRTEITDRKRGEEEISKSRKELRMLADHLQNIREEERNYLAREFHDQIGQSMTALKMDLSLLLRTISDEKQDVQRKLVAEELRSMQKLVDETIQLVWGIIKELHPQMLDDLGLVATFEWEAKQFESRTGISCEFKSSAGDIQMDSKNSIALFRIYQEALTNVAHHANATVVKSVLRRDNEVIVLEIKDNGCGITLNEQSKSNSFGLIGMRERALALDGLLKISGIAGEGTTIMVRLPLGQVAAEESTP
jgi:signal transduction histidine kinase